VALPYGDTRPLTTVGLTLGTIGAEVKYPAKEVAPAVETAGASPGKA